jgi:OmpA-OmpF porin, OOP family
MKHVLLSAAALGLVLGAPSLAAADEGWYLGGAIGYGTPEATEVTGRLGNGPNGGTIRGESNWREKISLGYQTPGPWRVEGEIAHRYNDTGSVGNHEDSRSSFQAWSAMANVLYDFNIAGVSPYLGAGIGFVRSTGSLAGWSTGTRPVGSVIPGDTRFVEVRERDLSVAYQGIAGIAWPLTERTTLDTEYRYFGYGSTRYDGVNVGNLSGHEVWAGLRYSFGAPAAPTPTPTPTPAPTPPAPTPAPQPVPTPAPACEDAQFVVYFEWDRSNVTDQSRNVINNAISTARNCGVAAVQVDGHADRSGSAQYNVGLSERRARAVRDELVRLGVPTGAISINAFGESRPAVATPDGVREPLNRRVEVLINLN